MPDREYWMPKDPPKPLTEGDVHQAILEAGMSVSKVHDERSAPHQARVVASIQSLAPLLSAIWLTLVVIAVGIAIVAVGVWVR